VTAPTSDIKTAAAIYLLWHHQGGFSPFGQEIRKYLGIEQHARISDNMLSAAKELEAAWNQRAAGAEGVAALEQLSEPEKDIALAQAVTFAEYVSDHAKGSMVEAAKRFLSLDYSKQIAARLAAPPDAVVTDEMVLRACHAMTGYAKENGLNPDGWEDYSADEKTHCMAATKEALTAALKEREHG